MKAWLCDNPTGVEALQWRELPQPAPAAGQIRVQIKAASLNFPDLLIVQNKYQMKPALPFVPGTEFSGVVTELGEGVKGFAVGQRIAAFGGLGGFATEVCIPAMLAMPLPDAFSFEDAAAFICTYATSHHALMDRAALRAGETVLILGAAGGVGTAAIQIAKAAGARVIAAAGSDAKCEACKALGADAAINYTTQNLRDELKSLTQGKGPDVIYDPVGGDLAEAAFRSIAWRGRYLVIGFAQGAIPALPLNLALLKGASIVGVFWGEFAKREPGPNAKMLGELAAWYTAGKIKPVIDRVLPMEELPAAFARMAAREVVGKLVLTNP
ncbi:MULTISPECIES: NADPH:quinone oxidoreductase family protein [unclassified Roseateles]|uniref:NADPH:quinone oxidoreductase family protein n=1 Tax=unclassified Roseateles TaxID=2626991 RepID=UPI0006FE7E8D|nr:MULTISPECIES: NADPH:quinone oxidoreductase family protein [unclassified Roseateles]KQW50768.1 NADPH:quinone oxidoreductase [Pelomonas sp. Root405]KRA70873.1 NADPH:quinone oxidoreductase [Pelomonas sp. Root662]